MLPGPENPDRAELRTGKAPPHLATPHDTGEIGVTRYTGREIFSKD